MHQGMVERDHGLQRNQRSTAFVAGKWNQGNGNAAMEAGKLRRPLAGIARCQQEEGRLRQYLLGPYAVGFPRAPAGITEKGDGPLCHLEGPGQSSLEVPCIPVHAKSPCFVQILQAMATVSASAYLRCRVLAQFTELIEFTPRRRTLEDANEQTHRPAEVVLSITVEHDAGSEFSDGFPNGLEIHGAAVEQRLNHFPIHSSQLSLILDHGRSPIVELR